MGLLLLLLASVSVSCLNHSVDYYVNGLKKEMPLQIAGGFAMTDINVVDNYVQISCTSDESDLDMDDPLVQTIVSSLADSFKQMFMENPDMKDFMQTISDEGKGFSMVVDGLGSGETLRLVEITPEEMNENFPPGN